MKRKFHAPFGGGRLETQVKLCAGRLSHYLSAAVERLESEGMTATDEQLAHILPVMWEHVNLLGRYEFDATDPSIQTDLSTLPLRSMDEIMDQLGLGM